MEVANMPFDDDIGSPEDREATRELQHEEGVLRKKGSGHEVGCDTDEEACAPSDYPEAAYDDDGTPGTPDDLPYTLGVEGAAAADTYVGGGATPTRAPEEETEEGVVEERELWKQQQQLLGQDEEIGAGLESMTEVEGERVLEALGDDAGEALPDSPEGTSATGAGGGPEHGGFPERREGSE
jgi:hypothetical protein